MKIPQKILRTQNCRRNYFKKFIENAQKTCKPNNHDLNRALII